MSDVSQRARELLAEAHDEEMSHVARAIRANEPGNSPTISLKYALRAIESALSPSPSGEDDELVARLRETADPFLRLYRLQLSLAPSDEAPLIRFVPGAWPTWGEFRRLAEALPTLLDRLSSLKEVRRRTVEAAALDALVEQAKNLNSWLGSVAETDMDEIVADGGITAAMVVRKEAGTLQKRLRCGLQDVFDARSLSPKETPE